jgi:hypothetical protein
MRRGEIRTGLEERTGRDGTGGVGGDKAKQEGARQSKARQAGRNLTVEARRASLPTALCLPHIRCIRTGASVWCVLCVIQGLDLGPRFHSHAMPQVR